MVNNFGVTLGFKYLLYQQFSGCIIMSNLLKLPQFLIYKMGNQLYLFNGSTE